MKGEMARKQLEIAARVGSEQRAPLPSEKVGIAPNVREGTMPLNGLRHPIVGDTSGWYFWSGEVFPEGDDAFVPLHIEHLSEWCPIAIPYLALAPGWRFLVAPGYEDVWFDESLLSV
jgi:hypothetical protein